MDLREEYKLRCAVTSQEQSDILHIEVKSKNYQLQCYYKHLTFRQLPSLLQSIFNNISHLFVYINQPDIVYFDDIDASVKICIPIAGKIREFPIKMQSKFRAEGLQHRIQTFRQAKAKSQDEFNKAKQEKQADLQEIKKIIQSQKEEKEELQKTLGQIQNNTFLINTEICQLNLQIQYQVNLLKKMNQSESKCSIYQSNRSQTEEYKNYTHSQQFSENFIPCEKSGMGNQQQLAHPSTEVKRRGIVDQNLQARKQFWIKEIGNLKKPKTLVLKKLVNPDARFQQRFEVQINGIQLKKMLFVEIFSNLEVLDLSNNHIKFIEGLKNLKALRKLDLSMNKIQAIKGVQSNKNLVQLMLQTNQITKIQNIFQLRNLRILWLSKNQIKAVPDKIIRLSKLVELKLGNNKVVDVSEKVQLLKNLKVFTIVGNKCYSSTNKSKDVIDRLINKGIKTTQ